MIAVVALAWSDTISDVELILLSGGTVSSVSSSLQWISMTIWRMSAVAVPSKRLATFTAA
jgi:hypothetical protein